MESTFDPDSGSAWQLRLFRKSFAAQQKLKNLRRVLSPVEGKTCLDVGGEPGVIPLMLRQQGGAWVSVTQGERELVSLQTLLGEDQVYPVEGSELPFEDASFDTIVVIHYLERIREDGLFLRECHRCLKPKGELVILVPQVKSFSLVKMIRKVFHLTDASLGRVRPGYRLRDLYEITKDGFDIVERHSFGGVGAESVETFLMAMHGPRPKLHGPGVPEHAELRAYASRYRTLCLLKPLIHLFAGLDSLFQFTCNHWLVIQAKPRPWIQRKSVKLKDGRSIAEAAIQTKIGSAAELVKPLPGT